MYGTTAALAVFALFAACLVAQRPVTPAVEQAQKTYAAAITKARDEYNRAAKKAHEQYRKSLAEVLAAESKRGKGTGWRADGSAEIAPCATPSLNGERLWQFAGRSVRITPLTGG